MQVTEKLYPEGKKPRKNKFTKQSRDREANLWVSMHTTMCGYSGEDLGTLFSQVRLLNSLNCCPKIPGPVCESNLNTSNNQCTTELQCLASMLELYIQLSWFNLISEKSYLLDSQCLCSCTFHKSSVIYTETLETAKTFQWCCHPHPPPPSPTVSITCCFSSSRLLLFVLSPGVLVPFFPSLSLGHQQHTDKTTNTSDSYRLCVKVHHGSDKTQWAKAKMAAAAAAGTDWLHSAGSLGLFL